MKATFEAQIFIEFGASKRGKASKNSEGELGLCDNENS